MSKNAWISVSVFAVLLVLAVATREDRVSVGMRSLSLPSIDKDKVVRLELSGSKSAVLQKAGDVWQVADPEQPDRKFAVDATAVDNAIAALPELAAGAFVTARAAKHEELELTADKGLRVKVEQEGGPGLDITFGRFAKGGGNYLRLSGSDEVFVGKGRFASLAKKDVKGWRKRKLVDHKPDELRKLQVSPKTGGAYSLEWQSEGEGEDAEISWRLLASAGLPEGFVVDNEALGRMASTFANLRAAELIDDKKPEEVGLGAGAGVKVIATAADGGVISVRFGDDDGSKKIYTLLDGDDQLYAVSEFTVQNLTKPVLQLRDLRLARFDPAAVERAVFDGPSGTVEVTRKDGAWTLTQPATPPADFQFDGATVEGKLAALGRVKAQERLEAAPPKTGLQKPDVTITLFFKDGVSKRVGFGAAAPKQDDKGGERFYASSAEDEAVYVVNKWQKTRYEKPLDLFKKVAPPPGAGRQGGPIAGMENLPPDIRKKLQESLKQQGGMPGR
jgi:hypothetical protein